MDMGSLPKLWPGKDVFLREIPSRSPKPKRKLADDEIHVWKCKLEVDHVERLRLWSSLSDEEKLRAVRFRCVVDRNRFVVTHGRLREIIGFYAELAPHEIVLVREENGKPVLGSALRAKCVDFNITHSGDVALFAFGQHRNIGIDVEKIEEGIGIQSIAETCLSISEQVSLSNLPSKDRVTGFFNCWTRKEAYLKARGDGLRVALSGFDVTLAPGTPARFLAGVGPEWQIVAFYAESNFPAALVYDGPVCKIRFLS
jgi:4'-phosphopantetheinyl transferase